MSEQNKQAAHIDALREWVRHAENLGMWIEMNEDEVDITIVISKDDLMDAPKNDLKQHDSGVKKGK